MARRVARLDEHGLAEMSKVVGDAVDRLLEIEKQSAQRLRKHHGPQVPTVLIAMLFDAPDDDPGPTRSEAVATARAARRAASVRWRPPRAHSTDIGKYHRTAESCCSNRGVQPTAQPCCAVQIRDKVAPQTKCH